MASRVLLHVWAQISVPQDWVSVLGLSPNLSPSVLGDLEGEAGWTSILSRNKVLCMNLPIETTGVPTKHSAGSKTRGRKLLWVFMGISIAVLKQQIQHNCPTSPSEQGRDTGVDKVYIPLLPSTRRIKCFVCISPRSMPLGGIYCCPCLSG